MSVTGGLNLALRYVTTEKADAATIALASRLAGVKAYYFTFSRPRHFGQFTGSSVYIMPRM